MQSGAPGCVNAGGRTPFEAPAEPGEQPRGGGRAAPPQQPQQPLCVSGEVGGRARGEGAWGEAGHDARALRRLTRLNHSTDFTGETDSDPGRGWLPRVAEAAAALDRGLSGPQRPCSSPRPWAQCDKGSGKVKKKQT